MKTDISQMVLAIDGGGSGCRLALAPQQAEPGQPPVAIVETGPANVSSDFEAGCAAIQNGLSLLSGKLGHGIAEICNIPAYLGLAGMTGAAIETRLRQTLPFVQAVIADDQASVARGALGQEDGALLHAGTGSFQAIQTAGCIRCVGGWGPVLGDIGSAHWLGLASLRSCLAASDDLAPHSPLTERLLAQFADAAGIISFATHAKPNEIAQIARDVTAAADTGDATAQQLLRQGAAAMCRDLQVLGWREGMLLCLTGGLAPQYAPYLPAAFGAAVRPLAGSALDGALSLARDYAAQQEAADG